MKPIFVAEDFKGRNFVICPAIEDYDKMARVSNEILEERLLKDARELFVTLENGHIRMLATMWFKEATHTMSGINLTPIAKVCEHFSTHQIDHNTFKCNYVGCQKKLKANWSEVKDE